MIAPPTGQNNIYRVFVRCSGRRSEGLPWFQMVPPPQVRWFTWTPKIKDTFGCLCPSLLDLEICWNGVTVTPNGPTVLRVFFGSSRQFEKAKQNTTCGQHRQSSAQKLASPVQSFEATGRGRHQMRPGPRAPTGATAPTTIRGRTIRCESGVLHHAAPWRVLHGVTFRGTFQTQKSHTSQFFS